MTGKTNIVLDESGKVSAHNAGVAKWFAAFVDRQGGAKQALRLLRDQDDACRLAGGHDGIRGEPSIEKAAAMINYLVEQGTVDE